MADIHTMHNTKAGRVFDVCNILFLGGVGAITILPFLYIIAGSFATEAELAQRSFFIFPKTFTLDAYKYVFSTPTFIRSMGVSIFITVVGTAVQLFFTFTMAYPLAKRHVKGRNLLLNLVIFSMLFSGGMIPTYLVVKSLGLLDTYWALILPMAINPFNLIIIKNFFQQLPRELEESAKIDGCSEIGVFWRIALPLSKPVIATFALFYAVGIWNDFFHALLYINDSAKWPLQMVLRQVTILSDLTATNGDTMQNTVPPEQGIKLAVIVIATLPILAVYPFLQKHFAKGMLIGSVKG
ncbi:carbohydrate ABC transporter permease [Bacillus spizizenii]|uniref:Carbohydrate ABC transporter permease n=3 Tax=Bacillus subtilis group TaxID=653685 RepID=A0A9Q4H9D3_BACSC|nr:MULTISPECIES: carbohydrate ABC transporter permease [Bacillus subtilis group]QCJ16068.1 carbohydrate ABC transporter permease [Bacillus subtilis]ADM36782.1 putative ABC transporter (permease) [Bacillus spizizenii str. W23]AJW86202.1 ABC transporter permease [Bacillus spizizenii]EFG93630.1 putative ABC transporter (permease) [Bacillus spizizenii ATCC 6633 = JCM 2499]KFK79734.1 binding--dependent transport system inner membrane component family protein [Bacillus spizizenii]